MPFFDNESLRRLAKETRKSERRPTGNKPVRKNYTIKGSGGDPRLAKVTSIISSVYTGDEPEHKDKLGSGKVKFYTIEDGKKVLGDDEVEVTNYFEGVYGVGTELLIDNSNRVIGVAMKNYTHFQLFPDDEGP